LRVPRRFLIHERAERLGPEWLDVEAGRFHVAGTPTACRTWAELATSAAAQGPSDVSGLFVDRLDRRMVACGNFLLQAAAMPLFMLTSPLSLYVACALLGVSIGNMVTLPGLIVQKEFPKAHFNRVVSLVLATCNFTYAFGPGLLGAIKTLNLSRGWSNDHARAWWQARLPELSGPLVRGV